VPFWAKDVSIGNKMINARAETVATRPGYRDAYRKMRCLIPASGFYEWAKMPDSKKQPVRVCMVDDAPFAFAGLWSRWGPRDAEIETCAIIMTEANELCARVYDRTSVMSSQRQPHSFASLTRVTSFARRGARRLRAASGITAIDAEYSEALASERSAATVR